MVATIYVTGQDGGCLFNNTTAQELGLISLHLNQADTQTKASQKNKETGLNTIKDQKVRNILHKHSKVFQGVLSALKSWLQLILPKYDINVNYS